MSVFDKIQNYSASNRGVISDIFDVSTPQGCFLAKLHEQGYLMYENVYRDSNGNEINQKRYDWLSDEDKKNYTEEKKFTELHNMLVTAGDQLVLANAGSGKALANDTKVITSRGYVPIGKLRVDDMVYGTDLKLHRVMGVFPQGKKKVNVLTITDGDSTFTVKCCDEHLWSTRGKKGIEVITTKDVISRLKIVDSIPLIELSSDDFDVRKGLVLRDLEKACIVLKFFGVLDKDFLDNALASDMGNCIKLIVEDRDIDFYNNLLTVLDNPYFTYSYASNRLSKTRLRIEIGFSDALISILKKSVIRDKYINKLLNFIIPLLKVHDISVFRLLEGKNCNYEIIKVEETSTEVDMTCIEVHSDNHVFLLEHLIPTHNTTALIFKIMHDIITGEATKVVSVPNGNNVRVVDDVFVGTFLKSGADELSERLGYWQRKLGYTQTADRISFSTLHAEFKRVLNAMGASTPIGDSTKYLKKAVDDLGIAREGNKLSAEDYNVIGGIVTYYRGRLDDSKYRHPSVSDYGLTPVVLDRLVQDFATQRQLAGVMDFEDLQELLYNFLYVTPNKAVQDFVANRYKYIYLDEFQDTSQIQYAILKFYARGRLWINKGGVSSDDILHTGVETLGKIVAVGDPDQCIYSWRGSDNRIIEEYFDSDFRPCWSSLSYNYRCPSNILDAVVPSIKINKGHSNREYKSSREGGICNGYVFSSYKSMLAQLVADIDSDMERGNTVAVLCRTNYDGVIPAFILESSGHYNFSISSQSMTLDSPLSKKLIAMTSIFTERSSNAVKNTLSMFVPRYNEWDVKQLVDTLKSNSKSIWQIDEADIEYSCPALAPIIKALKNEFYEGNKRVREKEIEALKSMYKYAMVEVFGGNSLYCESARAYIEALLFILDSENFESVFDFLDHINSINDRLHARINNTKANICIATVHEFKGKERDSVIVWNDSDGVFPSSKTDINNLEELEGERRVHYVACTRARKKSLIYTLFGKTGMFAQEMDLQFENPQSIGGSLSNKKSAEILSDDEKNLLNVMNSLE